MKTGRFYIFILLLIFSLTVLGGCNLPAESLPDTSVERLIDVPLLCQYPKLPTGCEATSAAMVLQYHDVIISAEEFAAVWLECSDEFYNQGAELYGPDPNKVFVGSPFTKNSYGCFADVIVNAVNNYCDACRAEKITDMTLDELCAEYIDDGQPLLIWATMSMKEPSEGNSWIVPGGKTFTWPAGEHCLVLVGYDEDYYFLNDPQSGSRVCYQKDIVQKRFSYLGSQAVYIGKKQ